MLEIITKTVTARSCFLVIPIGHLTNRAKTAEWLERRTHDQKVSDLSPGRSGWKKTFSPVLTFCADSYFSTRSTPVLLQQNVKDPGHSARSAGGRLQLSTHAPTHVASNKMTLQIGAWLYGVHKT